ncbi:hypothetical protein DPMN_119289 [Dreissena polymorpha]|uniref:Uncharacterized protein n=1 Tax=Dreissena polymorpha TaxID=45954 RepID=A0A9D4GIE6_DREPO|nr:hypothetical protein DPMN_119289 [Dreissena polymorpha]
MLLLFALVEPHLDKVMDEKEQENLSDVSIYVKGLDTEARSRYFDKLKYENGMKSLLDPYKIPTEKWSKDVTNWPSNEFGQIYISIKIQINY